MIHLLVGDGKGKTTSSIGMSIRAAGHGKKVLFVQFLKDDRSGEVNILRMVPEITVLHAEDDYGFLFQMTQEQKVKMAEEYDMLLNRILKSNAFMIVLDEVIHALNAGLVKKEKLLQIMQKNSEIVLTGRDAPEWVKDMADYYSDIWKIKHPFDKGKEARVGIEF